MQAEGCCDRSPVGPGENHKGPGFSLGVEGHSSAVGEGMWKFTGDGGCCRKFGNGMSCHGGSAVPTAGCN